MSSHRIEIRPFYVTCSCGWAYSVPLFWFENYRVNRAIDKHLAP